MKMSDRRKNLRPREKLQARGAEALYGCRPIKAQLMAGNVEVVTGYALMLAF